MDPPAHRRDKHGHPLADYPQETEYGRLLGVDASGNAAYTDGETVTLAAFDTAGALRVPVRERWLTRRFPLDAAGLDPGEYVLYTADETGPWRELADFARERVAEAGYDPERVRSAEPFEGDADSVLTGLAAGEPDDESAAGALRQFAMDRPEALSARLDDLLDVLADADVDPEGVYGEDRAGGYERLAVLADAAYAVARAARADPEALVARVEGLLVAAGGEREPADDPVVSYLLDALDVVGHARTAETAAALADRIDDPERAVPTLNALYRLEHRYANGDHPLLDAETLRAAVAAARERGGEVATAAEAVETLHRFHRGSG